MENEFDDIKVEKFPQDVFTTLADLLTYDWQKFSRCLLIDDLEIDNVKEEFETTREQTMQILNRWRKNNPSKKWRDMKTGLLFCNRNGLVSECERKLISRHSTFGVLPPTKIFFSRENELNQIHNHICETNTSSKSIMVLTGMSGVGKTQLARKYAAIYKEHFDSVVWVDAAFDKIQVSITNLCHQLGLTIKDSQGDPFDIEVVSRKIHHYFEREKTLYIFDNVDDESVKNFEKYVSNKKNTFTLVTSQWKSWSTDVNQVQVNSFSHQDALLFAKKNIKQLINDDKKLKEVTEVLHYHPLAINQAILYINNNSVSLQEWLNLFRSYPIEMLEECIPTEAETKSTITSINLVLNKIKITNEKSLEILNHLSYCDGQHITKKFIHGISKHLQVNEEFLIIRAIRLLVSYSLLDRFDDNNDRYAMHEMTQLACKCYQKRKEITKSCNENIADFLRLQLEDVNEHVDDGKQFYNHFIHMFLINKPKMCEVFHQQSQKIQTFLSNKGFFRDAINILDTIQTYNIKSYGIEHQITLDTKQNIAVCLTNVGKYNEALEVYYQIEEVKTGTLGINHSSTLDTKHKIANCLFDMRKYNEAFETYCPVDKMRTDILGINHPSTLDTKHNIALCLNGMGKYNEALEILYQVEKIRIVTFGINHPSILDGKHNIALCLNKMGKNDEALEIYYQVDKIRSETFGTNHQSTLNRKHNVALCLYDMGKYSKAFEIYHQVDKIQTDILGTNHPLTLNTKNNMGNCLNGMKKYNEALEILYQVDKIRVDILGINHPSTLNTKQNIALCLNNMGNYNEALEIYNQVDKIQSEILGINHPSTLRTKNYKAICLKGMGKYNEALEISLEVDKIQSNILGINHPSTLSTKYNIAICLYGMRKYNEALEIDYQVDKIQTDTPVNHPSTFRTKNSNNKNKSQSSIKVEHDDSICLKNKKRREMKKSCQLF